MYRTPQPTWRKFTTRGTTAVVALFLWIIFRTAEGEGLLTPNNYRSNPVCFFSGFRLFSHAMRLFIGSSVYVLFSLSNSVFERVMDLLYYNRVETRTPERVGASPTVHI